MGGVPFDANQFSGVVLWAKRGSAQASDVVELGLPTINDSFEFHICKSPPTMSNPGDGCSDDFRIHLKLTDDWRVYQIPFSALRQLGFGYRPPNGFAKNAIIAVNFYNAPGVAFDEWIDDVGFYK
jgi:hypothetical protein